MTNSVFGASPSRFAIAGVAAYLALGALARAGEGGALAPKIVIYPGDVVTEAMIADAPASGVRTGAEPVAFARSEIIGKMARQTLLPGRPIPLASLTNRRIVANGAEVRLIYREGGLVIVARGSAMQDGGVGDRIRVRNDDSGVTLSGAVEADGSIDVSGG